MLLKKSIWLHKKVWWWIILGPLQLPGPLLFYHLCTLITQGEVLLSWSHCHHTSASCFCLLPLPSHLKIFHQELSLSNDLCFPAGITMSSWTPLLILLWSWGALMRECPGGKVIRASLHLFFTCSSKVVLRLQTLLSNNYRHVSETTILTLCKKFMIGSLPFSSFF